METSNEQTEATTTETGEKIAESEAPVGEVTASDGSGVSAGGDAPLPTEGHSPEITEKEDATDSDPGQGESTVNEGTEDDVSASEPSQGDEPVTNVPSEPVEETEGETSEDVAEKSLQDDSEKKSEGFEEVSQDGEDEESREAVDPAYGGDSAGGGGSADVQVDKDGVEGDEENIVAPQDQEKNVAAEEVKTGDTEPDEAPDGKEEKEDAKDEVGLEEEKVEQEDDGQEDEVNLLSEVEDELSTQEKIPSVEDTAPSADDKTSPVEQAEESKAEDATGDDDALLKGDKGVGEEETGQDITAAEEDALLKETEEDENMEQEEAMDVEDAAPSVVEKGEDEVESMEVDEEPRDVEMRSEPGSVAPPDEEKDVAMEEVNTDETEAEVKTGGAETDETAKNSTEVEGEDAGDGESGDNQEEKQGSTEAAKDQEKTQGEVSEAVTKEVKTDETDMSDAAAGKSDDAVADGTEKQVPETEPVADKEEKSEESAQGKLEADKEATSEKEAPCQDQSSGTASEGPRSKATEADTPAEEQPAAEASAEEQPTAEVASEVKPSEAETDKDDKAENSQDAPDPADEDGDSEGNSQDTSKSPVTVGGEKKVVKKAKVGFSLGNIVSQLKKKAEKDEDGGEKGGESMDTTEALDAADKPKEDGDKPKEAASTSTSPTTPPAGSSRRKQHKASAQHITKDKEDGNDDDDDIVEIVDEKSNENEGQMKNYATDTMNELLGMFGFDKVDQQETQGLKLGEKFSVKPPPAPAKPVAPTEVKKAKAPIVGKETKAPEKKIHCTECKQPITGTTNLGWGSQPFCSPKCLTNFQTRKTSVCEYYNGLISQTIRGKFTKEMQMGQRKEFCSQVCVTEYTKRLKTCAHCAKEVKAADLIVAPVGAQNKFKEFCNQGCVDAFEQKRQASSNSSKGNTHPCAVCNKNLKVKHEVNYQNIIHRLCSNDCFNKFRTKNSLALNFCEQCGVICYNENLVPNVFLDGKMKRFCSQRCLGEYKVKNRRQVPCFNCKKTNTNHNMIEETGPTGEICLFCTMQCLQTAKSKPTGPAPQTRAAVSKTVTKTPIPGLNSVSQAAPCDHCRKNQRPLYHLTMSDNTIRNFCSYPCVIAFQAQFNVPPVTLPQETLMLKCAFCSTGFIHKPLTLEYKGSISLFCTQGCFDEFKRSNSVVVQCDYCHLEKILHDRSFFSGMAKSFCSEGCKLLFKQQFAQRLGLKCIVCDYCAQTCRSTVEMVYNKTRRRFCGIACRDKYDKWFNKTARCDGCKLMGRTLSETFMWRDEIKKVCDQKCLLLFYTQQNLPNMTTQGQVQIQGGTQTPVVKTTKAQPGQQSSGTPVIANVMSLASLNQQQQQSHQLQQSPLTKAVLRPATPVTRATKQTQITTAPPKIKPPPPPPAPLPPAPKMVRNKITLCKPFTQTKSVSCRPVHQHKSCQTDGPRHPILIPIPVPIYIPVPMQMYTTPVPFPVGINTPVPVPMFIPVAAADADKLIETIKEIKDKTPSDPLEAELLMMADAIAGEDDQGGDDNKSSVAADETSSTTTQENSTTKEEPDDLSSITMEEAEDVIPSDILAENILQMAAEMTNVFGEDQDLSEDIAALQAPDRPPTPQKPKPRRPKRRAKGGRNKRYIVDEEEEAQPSQSAPAITKSKDDAKKSIGINAFRYFVQGKLSNMTEKEKKRNKMLRPDVLECATEELYFGLCMFIKEARQPNGEKFPSDMLLLMFLSIQRELFDNERPENIFTDYEQFTQLLHKEVKDWRPIMDPTTDLVTNSLVDEESLWNSKQLGAHSPYILLSTLLYFNTKCFRLNGVEQHKELAFVRVQKHLRKTDTGRTMYLRYFPKEMMKKIQATEGGKRKRERDDTLELPEQCENTDNPLRCPVKLYEFYLSKCPESVKTRTDLFYLVPERSCIPDSPVWYTCQQLPDKDMNHILSRIMLTKDVHETWAAAANRSEEDYDSD